MDSCQSISSDQQYGECRISAQHLGRLGRRKCLLKPVTALSHPASNTITLFKRNVSHTTRISFIELTAIVCRSLNNTLPSLSKMKVKLELLLTRTISINVVDSDIDDPIHLAQQLQGENQEQVQSMKIVEVNGRQVGTSLDSGSALEVGRDQKITKFHRLIPALLQKLRKHPNRKSAPSFHSAHACNG